jgi:hypothetical protein
VYAPFVKFASSAIRARRRYHDFLNTVLEIYELLDLVANNRSEDANFQSKSVTEYIAYVAKMS